MSDSIRRIAILGSTGSIGVQALDVIAANPGLFSAEVLTAHSNADLLIEQAVKFRPNTVVIAREDLYDKVFAALDPLDIKVYSGEKSVASAVETGQVDMVLTALVGYAGLLPTLKAIDAGIPIALANKETLVVAGKLVTARAAAKNVNIYPVDSEHSAIFQCLAGEWHNPIEKIILTASGGPFRGRNRAFLSEVTPAQALKHPNWDMGAKITIDSATLMNKGLEVIEAKWLFNLRPDQIEAVVHPQSIIHSLVQFEDGSLKAQLGLPDMRLPIQYALGYPARVPSAYPRFSFSDYAQFTFEAPDTENFPCLPLAYKAMAMGGNACAVLNAANEVAVAAFLKERIGFLQIPELINDCLDKMTFIAEPGLEDYIATHEQTVLRAKDLLTLKAQ
ncbi:MAG: 1-deoxy-D-xylulose-5-phosphate reductoisomerase [Bacteroidota bacterium]